MHKLETLIEEMEAKLILNLSLSISLIYKVHFTLKTIHKKNKQ